MPSFPLGSTVMPSPGVNGSQIEVPLSGDLGERVPVSVTTTAGPYDHADDIRETETVPRQSLLPTSTHRTDLTVDRV